MKNLLRLVFALSLVMPLIAQTPDTPPPSDVNYAFGILLGQSLSTTGFDFDLDAVALGMKDYLQHGNAARMTPDQAKQVVSAALQVAQQKADEAMIGKEIAWMTEHGKLPGVITTPSGLQYEVLQVGTGAKPKLTETVKVNYVGTLIDGKEFDSSLKRGEPAVFTLDQVIPAWTEGLQLMAVGSKFRFTVPSKLAYGAQGAGSVIAPFTTLVFEVELLSIETSVPAPTPAQ